MVAANWIGHRCRSICCPSSHVNLGAHTEILVDTGIMSGADIVAAVALGARCTLVGRAYLYGLMAGGEAGVRRAVEILSGQLTRTMKLLGVTLPRGALAEARDSTATAAAGGPAGLRCLVGLAGIIECMFDSRPRYASPPEVIARFDELFERRYPSRTTESAALLDRIGASWRAQNRAAAAALVAIGELFGYRLARCSDTEEWAVDTEAAVSAEVAAALRMSQGAGGEPPALCPRDARAAAAGGRSLPSR